MGIREFFNIIEIAVIGLGFPAVILVSLWKFYRLLSKVNENLVGIRRAVERSTVLRV